MLENSEPRIITSRFSPTGKTTKFYAPCIMEGKICTISTFKLGASKKLTKGSPLKVIKGYVSERYGVEIKNDTLVRLTKKTISLSPSLYLSIYKT